MAYRDFADPHRIIDQQRITSDSTESAVESVRLGRDEWSVVEFARNDSLWSIRPDGLLQRLVRLAFGLAPARPLANERLEALRRFAVAAWRRRVDSPRVAALRSAGFTKADVAAVLSYIGQRLDLRTRPRGLA
jgi:hypothetical protein